MLVSEWTVRDGMAEAGDVAFATLKNRIALKGKLDIGKERFVDVTVAALDGKGCAKIRQTISGPFSAPQLDRVSALETVAASIFGLFEQTRSLLNRERARPSIPARWPSRSEAPRSPTAQKASDRFHVGEQAAELLPARPRSTRRPALPGPVDPAP